MKRDLPAFDNEIDKFAFKKPVRFNNEEFGY
jgi:hypothetical protein